MDGWLKVKSAAGYAGISERTLRSWLTQGLRHAKVNGSVLIKSEWIDHWIEKHECTENEADRIVAELNQ